MIREVLTRLRGTFRGLRGDDDLREELQLHLELAAEDACRYTPSAELARRKAAIRAGGITQTIEAMRDQGGLPRLSGLSRDVGIAFRMLRRSPRFTMIVMLTLGVGIAANAVAFAVLKTVVLNPLPYRDADRLVAIVEGDRHTPSPQTMSAATARDLERQTTSLEGLSLYDDFSVRPLLDGQVDMLRGMRVSANFFDTLGAPMFLGRSFRPDDLGQSMVILTYDTWMGRFGADRTVVGRSMPAVYGTFTVLGVLPPDFQPLRMSNAAEPPRMFVLMGPEVGHSTCRAPTCRGWRAIGRLRSGVTIAHAQDEVRAVMQQLVDDYPSEYPQGTHVVLTSLRDTLVGPLRTALWTIEAAVLLLLVLACANVVMLLLARTLARTHEMGIRVALGATRGQLIGQLLTESLLLGIGGGMVGISAAWVVTRLIASTGDANLPRIAELAPDRSMLLFAVAVTLATIGLCGLVPAIVSWRGATTRLRVGQGATGRPFYHMAARSLIALEMSVGFVVVLVVGLLSNSYLRVLHVDPGFDAQQVLTVSLLPAGLSRPVTYFDAVVDRAREIPGVSDVAYASTLPLSHPSTSPVTVREHPIANAADAPTVDTYLVSATYLAVMRIPVLRGRGFLARDVASAQAVAVVSESAARALFSGENPLNQHIQAGRGGDHQPWAVIVGVVGDVHQYALDRQPDAAVYLPFAQRPLQGWASLVIRSTVPTEQIESEVREAMVSVDSLQPVFHLQPMTTYLSLSVAPRTFTLKLMAAFGGVGLMLAMAGVFGIVSYIVEQRLREVGLRLALGASAASVQRLILRQVLTSAMAGVLCGIALTVAFRGTLSSLLFDVSPLDLTTVTGVVVLLIVAVNLASYGPIATVASLNPIVTLKSE